MLTGVLTRHVPNTSQKYYHLSLHTRSDPFICPSVSCIHTYLSSSIRLSIQIANHTPSIYSYILSSSFYPTAHQSRLLCAIGLMSDPPLFHAKHRGLWASFPPRIASLSMEDNSIRAVSICSRTLKLTTCCLMGV